MSLWLFLFFFSSRRRHTRSLRDWSSDVCSSDLATRVFGAFALVALLLAALGLYGLLAYSVTWRTREIGLRVALGARPRDVGRLVLREGLVLTLSGIALGLVVAGAATRLLESLLYGVRPTDGLTFAAVAALLLAVAGL